MIEKGSPEILFDALMTFRELNNHGAVVIDNRRLMIPPANVDRFFLEVKQFVTQMNTLPLFSSA